jgi:hypothetical protein
MQLGYEKYECFTLLGPLSLMRIIEELLERKVAAPV